MDYNNPGPPSAMQAAIANRYNELAKLVQTYLGITSTSHQDLLGSLHIAFRQVRAALIVAAQSGEEIQKSKLREQELWRLLAAQRQKIKALETELERIRPGKSP